MKKVFWVPGLVVALCVLTSNANAATYTLIMRAGSALSVDGNAWSLFRCEGFTQCVNNLEESADGALDAGLYAKGQGKKIKFFSGYVESPLNEIGQATSVRSVDVYSYMEASQGEACTELTVTSFSDGLANGVASKTYCDHPGSPYRRMFAVPPPGGGSWTPSKLQNHAYFTFDAVRKSPAGPRHYLAEYYVRIRYDAP